ncbi:MAG TPA: hypothetical protein VGF80_02090 [Galbitalea sp.]|jgi:hypothetical protein
MSDIPLAPPAPVLINRLAVFSLVCIGLAILSGLSVVVLELSLAAVTSLPAISPTTVTVAEFLVPTFYLVGTVLGVLAVRQSMRGRRALAVTGLVINASLLVLTVLGYFALTALGNYLQETLKG